MSVWKRPTACGWQTEEGDFLSEMLRFSSVKGGEMHPFPGLRVRRDALTLYSELSRQWDPCPQAVMGPPGSSGEQRGFGVKDIITSAKASGSTWGQ